MLANRTITLGSPTGVVVDRDTLVKPYLGVTGTSEDSLIDIWIEAAVDQAEAYCQRFFLQRSVVERIYDELPTRHLVLVNTPIASVTSITDVDLTAISSTYYTIDTEAGIVSHKDSGSRFSADLIVTYTAGWLAASIPGSIKIAICELVKQSRNSKTKDPDTVIRQSPDVGSLTFRGAIPGIVAANAGALAELPSTVQRALMPYRRNWA